MILPLAFFALSVTDAAFAGFRDAAGRDARIFKAELFRRAIRRGALLGILVSVIGCGLAAAVAFSGNYNDLLQAAQGMLPPLAVYATLVLVAMGVWATAEADLRTLASVVVLGPFTLVRPWVIIGAGALGLMHASAWPSRAAIVIACALQLAIEPWLGRSWSRT
jgi:hypothetical protein